MGVGAESAQAGFPSLYVAYKTADCTFKLTNDAGAAVTTIAPGAYQVVIATSDPFGVFPQTGDLTACKGFVQFRLTGPGVNVFTTLEYGDGTSEQYAAIFKAGATYTLQDDGNIPGTRRTLTVATSGSPAASTGSQGAKPDLVPSTANPLQGTLAASVTSGGKLSLSRGGKAVSTLTAGRWTFAVHDESRTAGFFVQGTHQTTIAVTSPAFVGWRDLTLTLSAGRWSFYSPGGKKSVFVVLS